MKPSSSSRSRWTPSSATSPCARAASTTPQARRERRRSRVGRAPSSLPGPSAHHQRGDPHLAAAMATAARTPHGVSTMHQSPRTRGAVSGEVSRAATTAAGDSTLGRSTRGAERARGGQIVPPPRGVEPVDPHHHLAPPVAASTRRGDCHRPRGGLGVGCDRVLQVEDEDVRGKRPRLVERPCIRGGHEERAPAGDDHRELSLASSPRRVNLARARIRAHLLRWRPRQPAQRTASTPRVPAAIGRRLAAGPSLALAGFLHRLLASAAISSRRRARRAAVRIPDRRPRASARDTAPGSPRPR